MPDNDSALRATSLMFRLYAFHVRRDRFPASKFLPSFSLDIILYVTLLSLLLASLPFDTFGKAKIG